MRGFTPGGCTALVPLPAAGAGGARAAERGGAASRAAALPRRRPAACGADPPSRATVARVARAWPAATWRERRAGRARERSWSPEWRASAQRAWPLAGSRLRGGAALLAGHVELDTQRVGSGAHRLGELGDRSACVGHELPEIAFHGVGAVEQPQKRTAPPAPRAPGPAPESWPRAGGFRPCAGQMESASLRALASMRSDSVLALVMSGGRWSWRS